MKTNVNMYLFGQRGRHNNLLVTLIVVHAYYQLFIHFVVVIECVLCNSVMIPSGQMTSIILERDSPLLLS